MELDKKLGPIWHVIVGEEFGFDMTYEAVSANYKHLITLKTVDV